MKDNKNYYEILEVSTDASQESITKGYTRAKNAYSQDSLALYSLMGQEETEEIQTLIEEAHSILSDPHKRLKYDRARGINQSGTNLAEPFSSKEHQLNQGSDTTNQNSITKIVAHKKFGLDFNNDPEMDKMIEQTVHWTGDWLRQIREYKQVDIPRLAEMTKVSKTYLRYIEEENFSHLPAEVYVRGFIYQYAKSLKLNPELVCSSFLTRFRAEKIKRD